MAGTAGARLPLAPSTAAVAHGIVASIFQSAVADRRIVASPCEGTRLPELVRDRVVPLDVEEVAALAEALPEHLSALVTLVASTGLRQGEAFGLTVDRTGLRPPSARPVITVDRQLVSIEGGQSATGSP